MTQMILYLDETENDFIERVAKENRISKHNAIKMLIRKSIGDVDQE